MTFQPVVPSGGLVGWRYLSLTLDRQMDAFSNSPWNQRDTDYFSETIASVRSAEALVSDRRLLRVALGAFGLQDDINNKAFIQKALEGGTDDSRALANRLADDRYSEFVETFGFGNVSGSQVDQPGFAEAIIDKFRAAQFEVAVGESDQDMRLALNASRELEDLANRDATEDTKWFLILGTPPLRSVFETALGLPSSFGQIDIEQQVETMKDLSSRRLGLGSIDDLSDPATREDFVEQFLLRSQISKFNDGFSSQSIALTLLQNIS